MLNSFSPWLHPCFVFASWKCLSISSSHFHLYDILEERLYFTLASVLLTGTSVISKRRSLVKGNPKLQPPYLFRITKFIFLLMEKILTNGSKMFNQRLNVFFPLGTHLNYEINTTWQIFYIFIDFFYILI